MQTDKLLHIAAGAAVAVLTTAVASIVSHRLLFPESPGAATALALWLGFKAALLAGWLKEEYDRGRPDHHTRDGWDAYATVAGALAAPLGLGIAALVWPLLY
jgi:hypothetical protein